jgi:hypothetical protein
MEKQKGTANYQPVEVREHARRSAATMQFCPREFRNPEATQQALLTLTYRSAARVTHPPQAEQCLERAGRWRRHVLHVLRVLVASSYGVAAQ